jgi:hypothetical protein
MFKAWSSFIQILEKFEFKVSASNTVQAGRQHAATSRARAPRVTDRHRPTLGGRAPTRLPDAPSARGV